MSIGGGGRRRGTRQGILRGEAKVTPPVEMPYHSDFLECVLSDRLWEVLGSLQLVSVLVLGEKKLFQLQPKFQSSARLKKLEFSVDTSSANSYYTPP